MSPTSERLLKDVLQLPEAERVALIVEVLGSLEPTNPSQRRSEHEWLTEVRRRAQAAVAGEPGLTWDEAIKRMTDRLSP